MTEPQQNGDTPTQDTPLTPPGMEPAPDPSWVQFENIRKSGDPDNVEYR